MTVITQKNRPKLDRYLGMVREDDNALGSGIIMLKGVEENPQSFILDCI